MHLDLEFAFSIFTLFFLPRCDREGQRRTEGGDRVVATLSHPEATGNLGRGSLFVYLPRKKDDPGIQGKHFYPGKTIGDNIGRRMGDGHFLLSIINPRV